MSQLLRMDENEPKCIQLVCVYTKLATTLFCRCFEHRPIVPARFVKISNSGCNKEAKLYGWFIVK